MPFPFLSSTYFLVHFHGTACGYSDISATLTLLHTACDSCAPRGTFFSCLPLPPPTNPAHTTGAAGAMLIITECRRYRITSTGAVLESTVLRVLVLQDGLLTACYWLQKPSLHQNWRRSDSSSECPAPAALRTPQRSQRAAPVPALQGDLPGAGYQPPQLAGDEG